MDKSLKQLLEAESQAEQLVAEGELEREKIIKQAMQDAEALEVQFKNRIPEIHQSFLGKANERATQSISELELRYASFQEEIESLAQENMQETIQAVVQRVLHTES